MAFSTCTVEFQGDPWNCAALALAIINMSDSTKPLKAQAEKMIDTATAANNLTIELNVVKGILTTITSKEVDRERVCLFLLHQLYAAAAAAAYTCSLIS